MGTKGGCGKRFPPRETHVVARDTGANKKVAWLTDWDTCEGMDAVRAVIRIKGTDAVQGQLAWQTAPVRSNNPNTTIQFVGSLSSTADQVVDTTVAAGTYGTNANLLIRFGVAYAIASGTADADLGLEVFAPSCGDLVATRTFQADADGNVRIEPTADWVPTLAADRVKLVIVVTSQVGGTIELTPCWRTADTSPEAASGWVHTGTIWNGSPPTFPYTGNGERNTGDLDPNVSGTPMWFQLGLRITSTGGFATATITVLTLIKRV